jgi:hypothetical protein
MKLTAIKRGCCQTHIYKNNYFFMNIKTFEQFKNDNKPMNEGLIDMLKARKEILKLQSVVCDEYERLLQEDPKRFHDGKSVLKAVKDFALEAYDKIVKSEDALSFSQWWEKFEKSNSYMLDNTIFGINESVDNYSGQYTIEITYSKEDDIEGKGEMGHAELYTQMLRTAGLEVEYKQKRFTIEATVTYNNKKEFDDVVRFAAYDLGYTDIVVNKLSKKMYDEVSEIVLNNSKPKLFR